MFVVLVSDTKDMGGFEVYIHSFLTSALCEGRVTCQLFALAVLLYDIKLPVAIEKGDGWDPQPVWTLGRGDTRSPTASGQGNRNQRHFRRPAGRLVTIPTEVSGITVALRRHLKTNYNQNLEGSTFFFFVEK